MLAAQTHVRVWWLQQHGEKQLFPCREAGWLWQSSFMSHLVPSCTEEKVVARCEMGPPLLCFLMALVSCVLPSILASQGLIPPKLKWLSGCSGGSKDGTTLVACRALSSGAESLTFTSGSGTSVQSPQGLGAAELTHCGSGSGWGKPRAAEHSQGSAGGHTEPCSSPASNSRPGELSSVPIPARMCCGRTVPAC